MLFWTLNEGRSVLLKGELTSVNAPSYEVTRLGTIYFNVSEREEACKLALHVSLPALGIRNHWDLWFYPHGLRLDTSEAGVGAGQTLADELGDKYHLEPAPGDASPEQMPLVITDKLAPYVDYLAAGGSVLLLGLAELPTVSPGYYTGWFSSGGNSVAVLVEDHPAVRAFPNDGYGAWQIEKLMGRALPYPDLRDQIVPIVSSFIWPRNPFRGDWVPPSAVAHLFEATVGKGKLLACGMKVLDASPEAEYLLDHLIRYSLSDSFDPRTRLSVRQLHRWLKSAT